MEFVKLLHILFKIWTNKLSLSLLYLGNIMLLLIYMAKKSLSDQLHTMDNNKKYNFLICLKWQWLETLRTVISRFNLRVMNKLKGPMSWFSTLVYRGSSHRRKSAVWHKFKILIWFGYIARLSHCGWRGYFTRSSDFYLPSLRLGRGGGQHPVGLVDSGHRGGGARNIAEHLFTAKKRKRNIYKFRGAKLFI